MFCVRPGVDFPERVNKICENNWKEYLGTTEERWRYYFADDIIAAAQKKGDVLMVSYVKNLEKYLKCAQRAQDTWDYPTKEELAEDKRTLEAVRLYAEGKTKSRLRSQHALLLMRCNMMLGRHQDNITFWEQTASQFINSVYRDMMQNIYAGALLKTGNADKAGELFAEMSDWTSLMTQYYKKRSYAAIRQQYMQNPNSAVLPFLLQDFVNNAQETVDVGPDGYPSGKLFVRDIQRGEAQQMIQFCTQVVKEGKSQSMALWQSAKAWLEFLYDNKKQAATDILAATKMSGSERQMDNVRVLMLYITAAQAPAGQAFDDYLADELQWLTAKKAEDDHYSRAMDRLVHQVLAERYSTTQPFTAAAMLKSVGSYEYDEYLDTMRVDELKRYRDYLSTPASSRLDQMLKNGLSEDDNQLRDLISTKYLRLCQWQQAIDWMKDIPLSYYNNFGYSIYAANRKTSVEPWITRQWIKEDEDVKTTVDTNPKLDFAREMLQMESELNVLSNKERYQRYYDLAVRYAQAHFTGDCWYLMRNGKSVSDTLRVNEVDLAERVRDYLQKASQTSDFKLKERALFGLCYGYLYTTQWQMLEWSDTDVDYVMKQYPQSLHFKAMAALNELEQKNATRTSEYVSRCDNFAQFRKVSK